MAPIVDRLNGMRPRVPQDQYKDIRATELYCPRCRTAVPVRERLLLVLPGGNLYDYTCTRCGESLGKRDEPIAGNFARSGQMVSSDALKRRR